MRSPRATYRLQFTPTFRFDQALSVLDYLHDLGVSHVYASPILAARRGSTHGYDVIDPAKINPDLGGEQAFRGLAQAVHDRGMGWIQDIVPNHMAFDPQNSMLMDICEHGLASPYTPVFDIEWNHPYESLRQKLLVPFLGRFYGECLDAGEIVLRFDQQGVSVNYYELRLPLRIESYAQVLSHTIAHLKSSLDEKDPDLLKAQGVLHTLRTLHAVTDRSERLEQVSFVKAMLWELYTGHPHFRDAMDDTVQSFNGRRGDPPSFAHLDELLAEQHYRLSFWKVATEEINYRRFFNINQLISVRVEDPQVFALTHDLLLRLLDEGVVDGLRIDHIDGLFNPTRYLQSLRHASPEAFIVVEKILHGDESLNPRWPVQGTTGYDFLTTVNGLFCERNSDRKFDSVYHRFIGRIQNYETLVAETKRLIIGRHMAGDVDRLAHLLKNVSSADRYGRDITLYGLRRALVELLTFFPAYRSYIDGPPVDPADRHMIEECVQKATEASPALLLELEYIKRFLLLEGIEERTTDEADRWLHFVMRFQQLTGPLMAKGFEDTAFYRYNKLVSLNDVGGNPRRFGISPLEFHQFNIRRSESSAQSLNATSTHDTKRGEDFRVRLDAISELPEEWLRAVSSWARMNRDKKIITKQHEIPDRNDEYFYYQTLVGSYPLEEAEEAGYVDRLKEYIIKAVREAKIHTAWLKPDNEYESGFLSFIGKTLEATADNRFREDFLSFHDRIARIGMMNSLAQVVLKATCPGVPDFYQGTEFWDFSFVDPDNRRDVDFSRRIAGLAEVNREWQNDVRAALRKFLERWRNGYVKLFTMHRLLQARASMAELFHEGEYFPLKISGGHRAHAFAFLRQLGEEVALVIVPRGCAHLVPHPHLPLGSPVWKDTQAVLPKLESFHVKNIFTNDEHVFESTVELGEVLSEFPIFVAIGTKVSQNSSSL